MKHQFGIVDIIQSFSQEQLYALVLLKADKSELIDAYSKIEDDALLLLKANVADIVDSNSKTKDDALLLLKVDKTYTYSKSETYTREEAYTQRETDSNFVAAEEFGTLLDIKANVVDIVGSHSKTEDDALLLLKTDKSDTYTKTETDTLLDAIKYKTELI
ncbi:MAG: hypothetical protein EZS28_055799, partial [Streblomastix strix]